MTVLADKKRYTPEELLTLPEGEHCELVGGELVEKQLGAESDWIGLLLASKLMSHVLAEQLGWVFGSETGYQCFAEDRNRVRKPDASFVRQGRLPGERPPKGYIRIAPDLAVEVVSPNDLYYEVEAKVEEYLRAGVSLVWVVIPETRSVYVRRPDHIAYLREDDTLTGEDVLPGFSVRVGDLFPPQPAAEPETEEEASA